MMHFRDTSNSVATIYRCINNIDVTRRRYSLSQPISYIDGTLMMRGRPDAWYLTVMPNSKQ